MKGVSPLLAAILLIAIVVVISGIIMTWFTAMTKSSQSTITNQTSQQVGCGIIIIQDVYLDLPGNVSRIIVRNSGPPVNIKSAEVFNTQGQSSTNATVMPIRIEEGEIKTIVVNITGIINNCDNFSQAIVSTENCLPDKYDMRAHGC